MVEILKSPHGLCEDECACLCVYIVASMTLEGIIARLWLRRTFTCLSSVKMLSALILCLLLSTIFLFACFVRIFSFGIFHCDNDRLRLNVLFVCMCAPSPFMSNHSEWQIIANKLRRRKKCIKEKKFAAAISLRLSKGKIKSALFFLLFLSQLTQIAYIHFNYNIGYMSHA